MITQIPSVIFSNLWSSIRKTHKVKVLGYLEMTTIKKLGKYVGEYGLIPKTGSGLTATDLKNLEKLNIIKMGKIPLKSGKAPSKPNAFELTDIGRNFIRMALKKEISVADSVLRAKKSIDETKAHLDFIKHKIEKVEKQIAEAEQLLNALAISTPSAQSLDTMSEEDIMTILKQAEQSADIKKKSGYLYSTEIYYSALRKYGLDDRKINDILYSLYDQNLLELQMGDSSEGRGVRTLSGKQFHWGKVKGGL